MVAYLKQWGLAVEREFCLERIGNYTFTREQAERLRDEWSKQTGRIVHVINLMAE